MNQVNGRELTTLCTCVQRNIETVGVKGQSVFGDKHFYRVGYLHPPRKICPPYTGRMIYEYRLPWGKRVRICMVRTPYIRCKSPRKSVVIPCKSVVIPCYHYRFRLTRTYPDICNMRTVCARTLLTPWKSVLFPVLRLSSYTATCVFMLPAPPTHKISLCAVCPPCHVF